MHLWLVRHAVAEELSDAIPSDFDRPLTEKGRRKFQRVADALRAAEQSVDLILTSPLVRAMQTAEILRQSLRLKRDAVQLEPLLAPGFDVNALLGSIKDRPPVRAAALVGHEPDFSAALSTMIGGGRIDFGKGAVACIEFTEDLRAGAGTLRWFVRPSVVE